MDKESLRQRMRGIRLRMPEAEVLKKSEIIIDSLIKLVDWNNIESLHCYQPINHLNEVDTRPLLDFLKIGWPQVDVIIQNKSRKLPYQNSRQYDLIIVPTLAFDNRGFRLGWGGGFYDQFLAKQNEALKVGLSFEAGRVAKIPNEPHDIKLDLVITESSK
ncbi:MAG TPA: 5-formyltetrahydrofolate cyclo-ligase [Candidatus Saccharimonadales bacterium]|nr:5-formyltetrahydrofolate cyclo-ligase [Candidatus Saccharimonadales bacterium]